MLARLPCQPVLGTSMTQTHRSLSQPMSAVVDAALVVLAMAVAYYVRFNLLAGIDHLGTVYYHLAWSALISPVFVFLYGLMGASDYLSPSTNLTHLLGRTIAASSIAVGMLIVCVFVFRLVDMSRLLLVLFWLFATLFSCLKTVCLRYHLKVLHSRGIGRRRIVLVGSGINARHYSKGIERDPASPFEILGSIGTAPVGGGFKLLGGYDAAVEALDELDPDEIVVALDSDEHHRLDDLLIACEQSGCRVSIMPNYYEFLSSRAEISVQGGTPVINISHVPLDNIGYAFLKRVFDLVGSVILIVLTSPIMLVAAIGTKLSSPGPIIFTQERVGRGKRVFPMYKFRSMRVNDEQDTAWTTADDPRKTKFGSFMRRFSIDELPQLFNVLVGDMSLVGPRPELPTYVDRFKVSIPLYMVRHQVRPGMTGWSQINGLRGDTSIEKRVTYDLYYINNWSLLFDFKILLLTPAKGVLHNDQETLAG